MALLDLIKRRTGAARSFVDLGCVERGTYSQKIINELGIEGIGISPKSFRRNWKQLNYEIDSGNYLLIADNFSNLRGSNFDFGLTWINLNSFKSKNLFMSDCIQSIKRSGQFYFLFPVLDAINFETIIGSIEAVGFRNIELRSNNPKFDFFVSISNYFNARQDNWCSFLFRLCRYFINQFLIYPWTLLQSAFYGVDLGTIIIAVGDKE